MAWQSLTRDDRKARKTRRARRRARYINLEEKLWAAKEQAARTAYDEAAVEYDWARKKIKQAGGPDQRAPLYEALREALAEFNRQNGWR